MTGDEGERTNEPGQVAYEANSKQFDVHPFFCRAARWDDLPPETKAHYASVERAVLAALSPAQTGGTAEPVGWMWRAENGIVKLTTWRPDRFPAEPLYAAPVAEGAREDDLLSFVRDMAHGYNVNHTSKFVRDRAQAILQVLDTGTNRGGGPG